MPRREEARGESVIVLFEVEMAANLVRVRKFAILNRKIRSSQKFAPKFANFFRGYFSYKKEDFKKNPQFFLKKIELYFDLGIFFRHFSPVCDFLFSKFAIFQKVRLDSKFDS